MNMVPLSYCLKQPCLFQFKVELLWGKTEKLLWRICTRSQSTPFWLSSKSTCPENRTAESKGKLPQICFIIVDRPIYSFSSFWHIPYLYFSPSCSFWHSWVVFFVSTSSKKISCVSWIYELTDCKELLKMGWGPQVSDTWLATLSQIPWRSHAWLDPVVGFSWFAPVH